MTDANACTSYDEKSQGHNGLFAVTAKISIVGGNTKNLKNRNENALQKPDIFKNTNTKLAKSCIFLSSVGQGVNIV